MFDMSTTSNVVDLKPATEKETFGQRFYETLRERKVSMKQEHIKKWFAERNVKISATMINKYKNSDAVPRMKKCRDFADALGVTVEWLYTGRGSKYPTGSVLPEVRELNSMILDIEDQSERNDYLGHFKTILRNHLKPSAG